MQLTPSQVNSLRLGITIALRVLVCIATVAALLYFALIMVLNMVLCGPSVTARNQLTLTLLANESTRDIPSRFLSQQTIDEICGTAGNFLAGTSDPALITGNGTAADTVTLPLERGIATVQLCPAADASIPTGSGPYYWGLSPDGVLMLSTEAGAEHATGACEAILILNGQPNEALFDRDSGFAHRVAVGQSANGTMILVTICSAGDQIGATWQELINIMTEYGAVNACCLSSGIGSEG